MASSNPASWDLDQRDLHTSAKDPKVFSCATEIDTKYFRIRKHAAYKEFLSWVFQTQETILLSLLGTSNNTIERSLWERTESHCVCKRLFLECSFLGVKLSIGSWIFNFIILTTAGKTLEVLPTEFFLFMLPSHSKPSFSLLLFPLSQTLRQVNYCSVEANGQFKLAESWWVYITAQSPTTEYVKYENPCFYSLHFTWTPSSTAWEQHFWLPIQLQPALTLLCNTFQSYSAAKCTINQLHTAGIVFIPTGYKHCDWDFLNYVPSKCVLSFSKNGELRFRWLPLVILTSNSWPIWGYINTSNGNIQVDLHRQVLKFSTKI